MNKSQIIKHLDSARHEHGQWVSEGRKILKGLDEDTIQKPQKSDDCNFTIWYEAEGHKLVNIPQLVEIQELHHDLHSTYTALYYVTFDRRKKARVSIIRGDDEIPVDQTPFRNKTLKALETKTIRLVKLLFAIEKSVKAMEEDYFESGWFV